MKVEVLETFKTTKKVKNLKRANKNLNVGGYFYKGDTFECDEEFANKLTNRKLAVILLDENKDEDNDFSEPIKEKENTSLEELDDKKEAEEDDIVNPKPKAKKTSKSKK